MIRYLIVMLFALNAAAQTPCEKLKALSLPNATISAAELIPAGLYKPESKTPPAGPPAPAVTLPSYCRVAAILTPSADSNIEMEIWLPAENWNGKFQAVGNGGWAGIISFPAMALALYEGYATASTDTGHKSPNALFGIGHPEKVVDYAYRAVHETAVKSKAIISAFYGKSPRFSYWNGCSTGGRQGLMEAQRYPEDFDGIVAGAPANYHSHLHGADMMLAVPIMKDPATNVSKTKLTRLNGAVMAACDNLDGVKDGLLENPHKCRFDPSSLLCTGGEGDECFTAPQLEAVKNAYAPLKLKTGEIVFPGKTPGSETEMGWSVLSNKTPSIVSTGTFQLTYQDEKWDWQTFEPDRDLPLADQKTGFINAIQPDLKAFKARGGKLLLYHGWNDSLIAPDNTINYYSSVLEKMGAGQENWLRLFMIPGVAHCSGGTGPSQANFMSAMERWREAGEAPGEIEAYRVNSSRVDMTRPLCPYPQVAHYRGVGSTNDKANFVCKAP
jgi:feruloyl esterase